MRGIGVLTVLASAAAVGWGGWLRREIAEAERTWQMRMHTAAALGQTDPAPSEANVRAMQRDLETAERQLRAWRAELAPDAAEPVQAAETYFTLAEAVAAWRGRAARAGIGLRAGEQFGFAAYAETGPTAAQAPAVGRQRRALEPLLAALVAARPTRLDRVRRQAVEGEGPTSEDYLAGGPVSAGRELFGLEFTGQTRSLREFLNAVAALQPVALVREVAVEPLKPSAIGERTGTAERHFSVVVECLVPSVAQEVTP